MCSRPNTELDQSAQRLHHKISNQSVALVMVQWGICSMSMCDLNVIESRIQFKSLKHSDCAFIHSFAIDMPDKSDLSLLSLLSLLKCGKTPQKPCWGSEPMQTYNTNICSHYPDTHQQRHYSMSALWRWRGGGCSFVNATPHSCKYLPPPQKLAHILSFLISIPVYL